MKKILLFTFSIFFCGLFTFLGSILGNAFGTTGLFIGAVAGGLFGIVLCTLLLFKFRIIETHQIKPVFFSGSISFLIASLFAATNLNSPVIPLLSMLLVGAGCIIGNNYSINPKAKHSGLHILAGFILMLPALYFVIGSVIKYNLGFSGSFSLLDRVANNYYFNLLSPFLFFGGLFLAMLLNLPFRFNLRKCSVFLIGTGRINLLIAITSVLLMLSLISYLIVENF